MINRRALIVHGLGLATLPAWAHHGWSSFDQTRPIYLEGRIARVQWRNPHAELDLELSPSLALPADLAGRTRYTTLNFLDAAYWLREEIRTSAIPCASARRMGSGVRPPQVWRR